MRSLHFVSNRSGSLSRSIAARVGYRMVGCLKKLACSTGLMLLAGVQAHATLQAAPLPGEMLVWKNQGLVWKPPERSTLFGVTVWYRHFSSSEALGTVAEGFARNEHRFQRVVAHRNRLILSGIENGHHWLADVSDAGSVVSGYVSVLPFRSYVEPGVMPGKDTRVALETGQELMHGLLPSGSTRILQHQSADSTQRQEIYRVPLPWQSLSTYLERALRSSGWLLSDDGLLANGPKLWSRGQARMMLSLRAAGQGSALYVHHMP